MNGRTNISQFFSSDLSDAQKCRFDVFTELKFKQKVRIYLKFVLNIYSENIIIVDRLHNNYSKFIM